MKSGSLSERVRMANKTLKFEVIMQDDKRGMIAFCIKDQSHRDSDFGDNGCSCFKASNGIGFLSQDYPDNTKNSSFRVRGKDTQRDKELMTCTFEEFDLYLEAALEYEQ